MSRAVDHITATPAVTSHEGSQIPLARLVMVIRLLQALMLLLVISSLPNLLTAWYSKHLMRAHVAQHFV